MMVIIRQTTETAHPMYETTCRASRSAADMPWKRCNEVFNTDILVCAWILISTTIQYIGALILTSKDSFALCENNCNFFGIIKILQYIPSKSTFPFTFGNVLGI